MEEPNPQLKACDCPECGRPLGDGSGTTTPTVTARNVFRRDGKLTVVVEFECGGCGEELRVNCTQDGAVEPTPDTDDYWFTGEGDQL